MEKARCGKRKKKKTSAPAGTEVASFSARFYARRSRDHSIIYPATGKHVKSKKRRAVEGKERKKERESKRSCSVNWGHTSDTSDRIGSRTTFDLDLSASGSASRCESPIDIDARKNARLKRERRDDGATLSFLLFSPVERSQRSNERVTEAIES